MDAKISLLKVIFELSTHSNRFFSRVAWRRSTEYVKRLSFSENIGNHHILKDLIRFYKIVLMTTSIMILLSIFFSIFGLNVLFPLVLLVICIIPTTEIVWSSNRYVFLSLVSVASQVIVFHPNQTVSCHMFLFKLAWNFAAVYKIYIDFEIKFFNYAYAQFKR